MANSRLCDVDGKPDWHLLRPRSATSVPGRIGASAAQHPATLFLFDVLVRAKRNLRPAPLSSRRQALRELVVVSQYDDGKQLFKSVTAHGLEGVVGKRMDSVYTAGRTAAWLNVRAPTARPQQRR